MEKYLTNIANERKYIRTDCKDTTESVTPNEERGDKGNITNWSKLRRGIYKIYKTIENEYFLRLPFAENYEIQFFHICNTVYDYLQKLCSVK